MKKSVIFLINGLGIEKPGSYSISIDQAMPKLARIKETSYYTTAVISSIEFRTAYEKFFLGDTYQTELDYIKKNIIDNNIEANPAYQFFTNNVNVPNSKLHIFLEPINDKVVEQINEFVNKFNMDSKKEIYLHLILNQQTLSDYDKLINVINFIKFRIDSRITVGFVIGKEVFKDEMTKDDIDTAKKLFFFCSAERWTETEKKLLSLKEHNVRPCDAEGFCTNNDCNITNGDTIMFFNTRSTNYDKFINAIYLNCANAFKTDKFSLPIISMVQLDSKYNIPCFSKSIEYENSLVNILSRANKKALIITSDEKIPLINFFANGLKNDNNPNIGYMKIESDYYNSLDNITKLIDDSEYDIFIFDYYMDVSRTVNYLKEQLEKIDVVLGNIGQVCENKHSLFITSLYGLRTELPIADYNNEIVTIDYEMQIPIFFNDFNYPHSKYTLIPGETNDVLNTAIKCVKPELDINSLIYYKGLMNNLISTLKKN